MGNDLDRYNYYMGFALEEANKAYSIDEVPIGAVIVYKDRIIGRGHNKRECQQNPTAHAEMLAITEAAKYLGSWRLLDTEIYVTMEPCAMCAGALVLARIKSAIYAVEDPKGGACGSVFDIMNEPKLNHIIDVTKDIRAEESRFLIQKFFKEKRALKKKAKQQNNVTEKSPSG